VRNGSRLIPGAEWALRDGDRIRLGAEVTGLVRLVAAAGRPGAAPVAANRHDEPGPAHGDGG
jgi:hypothetical protein